MVQGRRKDLTPQVTAEHPVVQCYLSLFPEGGRWVDIGTVRAWTTLPYSAAVITVECQVQ